MEEYNLKIELISKQKHSCHASTLEVLSNGDIFAAWFAGAYESSPTTAIWGARRTKDGWAGVRKLVKANEFAHWNPVLFLDKETNILHLFFKAGRSPQEWQTFISKSEDDGDSWSVPYLLTETDKSRGIINENGRGPVRNKPIVLSNGSWVAGGSYEHGYPPSRVWRAFVDISRNAGQSWRQVMIESSHNVIQPTLWESEPGYVHMLLRSDMGMLFRADSDNYGDSWGQANPVYFPNNNSGIDVVAIDKNLVVVIANPVFSTKMSANKRSPLGLYVYNIHKNNWVELLDIETQKGEYSYPAIVKHGNDLHMTYTHNRKNIAYTTLELT